MKRALLLILVAVLYIVHQDFWFWRTARPLVFGFIPIGLFYHACYTVATAFVIWLMVKYAWPAELENTVSEVPSEPATTSPSPSFPSQRATSSGEDSEI